MRPDLANPSIGKPLTIGGLTLRTNMLLAPVANYCDLAWRLTCRELGGVGLACTDLLSPHGLLRGTAHSLDLAMTTDEDRPLGMQLYGNDADLLAEGALWAINHGATLIDINMGCPVDKVCKKDGGSKMMCDLNRTIQIAAHIAHTVGKATHDKVPVTAKMRLGWDDTSLVAPDLAAALCKVGIAAITVHGRTAAQRFQGEVSRPGIRRVVEAVHATSPHTPVIGNGDVTSPAEALRMLEETNCNGVMIGRGSFSSPWIFQRCWDAQLGLDTPEPAEHHKIEIIRRYLELMLHHRDPHYAMNHIRRRISWLGKTLGPCKPLKETIRTAPDPQAVHDALDQFQAGNLRGNRDAIEVEEAAA